jgi:hypothetical protein
MRIAVAIILGLACLQEVALASEFDGWTLNQLKEHPRFVAYDHQLAGANLAAHQQEWAGPGAPLTHKWIGYIVTKSKLEYPSEIVAIDDQGMLLTCTDNDWDLIPSWALDAWTYLVESGYIEGYPD